MPKPLPRPPKPPPPQPPAPPPAPTPPPAPPSSVLGKLSGTVRTKRPNGGSPYGIPWSNVTRYEPAFSDAAAEFRLDPRLLAAMAVVESDSSQFDASGRVVSRDDGFGDGPSVGIMQVKPRIWQSLLPAADPMTAAGNIRLGAAIMARAIAQQGSWQKAITTTYFPANDPNGTTQNAYVQTVAALMAEMVGTTPPPPPADVDPIRAIAGDAAGRIDYGFRADAGLNYYKYGTGHGTTADTQHTGVDVPMPRGTLLRTPLDGVVLCVGDAGGPNAAGWGNACGSYPDTDGSGRSGNITILLDGGLRLTLGHCSAFNVGVGQRVRAGDIVGRSGGMNGPHVHCEVAICDSAKVDMRIARYPGCYYLIEPIAALKAAMAGQAPAVYAERLPVPQPSEFDVSAKVVATTDGVPVLQRADLGSAPVRAPLAKGEDFQAVFQVIGNDKRIYWISTLGSRIPVAGTASSEWPT